MLLSTAATDISAAYACKMFFLTTFNGICAANSLTASDTIAENSLLRRITLYSAEQSKRLRGKSIRYGEYKRRRIRFDVYALKSLQGSVGEGSEGSSDDSGMNISESHYPHHGCVPGRKCWPWHVPVKCYRHRSYSSNEKTQANVPRL